MRAVAYGWYDGPTSGILECGACARLFRFDTLAELTDAQGGDDLRIYRLAPLPAGAIEKAVEVMAPYEEPRWPVWVPLVRDEIRETVGPKLDELIAGAGAAELIIGCLGYGRVYAVRRPPEQPVGDWLEYVGHPDE